jgi:predicted O-methyltransferase YrrM
MTAPTEADKDHADQMAETLLEQGKKEKETNVVWAYSSLEEVKRNIALIGYPESNIEFIKGDVLKTIPTNISGSIALLRLDTDWYESTKHELEHLYPLLQAKGVLIIDDYGFWRGSRKAVDEYFHQNKINILLSRMDDTGRVAIKTA